MRTQIFTKFYITYVSVTHLNASSNVVVGRYCRLCFDNIVAVGQVLKRLKLTWRVGQPRNPAEAERVFTVLLAVSIIHVILLFLFLVLASFVGAKDDPMNDDWNSEPSSLGVVFSMLRIILGFGWHIIVAVWVFQIRQAVRKIYAIPGDDCCDCLCAWYLPCCTIGQILRHTTDYDKNEGSLYTSDGLRPNSTLSTATSLPEAICDDLSLV